MRRFKSVLIVDDDQDVREAMADVLSSEGHPTVVAADGEQALAALERCDPPTLVLLDSAMPRMGGAAFLERLRRLKPPRDIRVVVISGSSEPRPKSPFVTGELQKPFELDALLALLAGAPDSG